MAEVYRNVNFGDDGTDTLLDKRKAIEAWIKEMQLRRESRMKVVKTRWLDINKGDNEDHELDIEISRL